jgi:hypothetical protein
MSATHVQSVPGLYSSSSVPTSSVPVRPVPTPVSVELATSRAFSNNPNHHLWRNGRLWWIAFTLIHDGWRQERVRQSLGTDSLTEARRRRDSILAVFAKEPLPVEGCLDPDGCDEPENDYASLRRAVNG